MKTNSVLFVVCVLAGLLFWVYRQPYDVEAQTVIDAPPERIWQVLTDTAAYPEWNPVIVSLTGNLQPGQQIEFQNRGVDGKTMTFRPRVLKAEASHELRWLGHLVIPGLFDGEHYFILTRIGNQTRVLHGEHFRGMLVPFVRGWLEKNTKPDYSHILEALKQRAEKES